jgi:serine/threonine protein kinase
MRKLKHDNIMKLYEVYESENSLYMCLELLEGGSLYDLIKSREILSLR